MPKDPPITLQHSSRLKKPVPAPRPSSTQTRLPASAPAAAQALGGHLPPTLLGSGGPNLPQSPEPADPLVCSRAQHRQWRALLLSSLKTDLQRFAHLISSRQSEADAEITAHATALVLQHPELPPPVVDGNYFRWVILEVSNPCSPADSPIPPALFKAAAHRKAAGKQHRQRRKQLNNMLFTPSNFGHLSATMFNFWVDPLPSGQEFPPRNSWVAENLTLYNNWAPYLKTYKLPDLRRKHSPTVLLDHSKLHCEMPADLNFQIFDNSTGELVFRMVRNFCSDPVLLAHSRKTVFAEVTTKKSVRLEDRGSIIQIGFTAGSRAAPEFGWARNTLSKKADEAASNHQVSSLMAAFWLIAKQAFPSEVIYDFENFYVKNDLPHLHPGWPTTQDTNRGPLELPSTRGTCKWDDVELAPGCAVMVQRYARAVHQEHQGHHWALNWTVAREGTNPQGGNFLLATYGILIHQSANCAFSWRPAHWHATTLALFPSEANNPQLEYPTFNQYSVAFVTSNRIAKAFKDWRDSSLQGSDTLIGQDWTGGSDEIYD